MRNKAFGETHRLTLIDRFGLYLSSRAIRRWVPDFRGLKVGDFGCGFHAMFLRSVLAELSVAYLVDVSLASDLKNHPKVIGVEGDLSGCLEKIPDVSLDLILSISVIEHLDDPLAALVHFRRILAADGTCLVNVPSWRGKWFLEYSAFTLGLSPKEEVDDHKTYFDPKDLWPLMVKAGFKPSRLKCFKHKFGLNTFAVARA